jgi:hypothetical protein
MGPRGLTLCYHEDVAKPSLVHQGYQLARHLLPALIRPARTLWHEVIGFLFLALAVWPIPSGIRTLRELDAGQGSVAKFVLTAAFVAIMAGYGISCFRRARKISRS